MLIKTLPLGPVEANCYILTDESSGDTAVIDCGGIEPELDAAIAEAGADNVKYILFTHGHFDHIWGAAHVKRLSGAKILIHENDADCLFDETRSLAYRHFPGNQEIIRADETLAGGDLINLGATEIKVIHTPGHSKGSVCFLAGNCLFTGDTLFRLTVGRTDFPDSDINELYVSIKRLIDLPGDYKVYPGHNRPTTLDAERRFNRFLREDFFRGSSL